MPVINLHNVMLYNEIYTCFNNYNDHTNLGVFRNRLNPKDHWRSIKIHNFQEFWELLCLNFDTYPCSVADPAVEDLGEATTDTGHHKNSAPSRH